MPLQTAHWAQGMPFLLHYQRVVGQVALLLSTHWMARVPLRAAHRSIQITVQTVCSATTSNRWRAWASACTALYPSCSFPPEYCRQTADLPRPRERTDCSAVPASITHGVEYGEGGAESTVRSSHSRAQWVASSAAAPPGCWGFGEVWCASARHSAHAGTGSTHINSVIACLAVKAGTRIRVVVG